MELSMLIAIVAAAAIGEVVTSLGITTFGPAGPGPVGSQGEEARRAGWAVSQADDPGLVPVTYPGGRFLLTADGGRIPYREKEIAA